MSFSPASLYRRLSDCPAATCFWVAYSGGVDSHVLLHALAALRDRLTGEVGAVHVNHGLQEDALEWERHCRDVCAALAVRFVTLRVDGRAATGESPEAAARAARYAALREWLPAGHCLLTAQHRDDQAETLLLQLLRGSGVRGLAAMPERAELGAGHLRRPLLAYSRQALLQYAGEHRLQWVDDPSNRDLSLDRNFLRHCVLPELRRRWPALSATVSRSARHCAEAALIMEQLAGQDVARLAGEPADTLPVSGLRGFTPDRRRNALRYWLMSRSGNAPSAAVLTRIDHDILNSRPDADPCVRWGAHEVRRYRDRVYLLPRAATGPDPDQWLQWTLDAPLELPAAGGVLSANPADGRGIRADAIGRAGVRVGYRRGGERCRPAGRVHRHALKKLFQEHGVPPWERVRIPLIYIENELAAVAGYWVCDPFTAGPGEQGLDISWSRVDANRCCP